MTVEKSMLVKGQPVPDPGARRRTVLDSRRRRQLRPGARPRGAGRGRAQALPRHAAGAPRRRPHDAAAAPGPPRLLHEVDRRGGDATSAAPTRCATSDWIFPSYREQGACVLARLHASSDYINQLFGNVDDPVKGRQMPVHHSANWLNFVSISSPVGTQIPQAVGMAHGRAKIIEARTTSRWSTSARARRRRASSTSA